MNALLIAKVLGLGMLSFVCVFILMWTLSAVLEF